MKQYRVSNFYLPVNGQYHIEGVLGVTKAEGNENARTAIALLDSRKTGFFSLEELSSLLDWLVWNDAAANGEEDAETGLTRYRDARCKRRHARALSKLVEFELREVADKARPN